MKLAFQAPKKQDPTNQFPQLSGPSKYKFDRRSLEKESEHRKDVFQALLDHTFQETSYERGGFYIFLLLQANSHTKAGLPLAAEINPL